MSLLDRGNTTVIVYPEEEWIDPDGNIITRPAAEGYEQRVMIQPRPQSGTSSRRAEQDNEGFEIETTYRMRVVRGAPLIDSQARIEWNGQWWSIVGDPLVHNGSRRTAHVEYVIRRT